LKNLQENPKMALAWWGEKGGFQMKADIMIHTDGEIFRQNVEWVRSIKETLNPKSAVVGKITGVYIVKSGPNAGKKIL
jgi:predicted pyridoxine 5'-phosphate oxidase superfamily flavin-nucleotide-binding protein